MDPGPAMPDEDDAAPRRRRASDHARPGETEDVVGTVLRAVALAAVALSLGVAASLLVESRPAGYLAVPTARP